MKSNMFLGLLFCLLACGILMFTEKLGFTSFFDSSGTEEIEEYNVSPDQWHRLLVGNWGFLQENESQKAYHIFSGEVEYFADGTFVKHITHKYYIPKYSDRVISSNFDKNELGIIEGGVVKGKWKVIPEKGVWIESISKCKISREFTAENRNEILGYQLCDREFSGDLQFGTYSNDEVKFSLNQFSYDGKIKINGRNFIEGTYISQNFDKK